MEGEKVKEYFLRTPPNIRDAHEARMWTLGFDDISGIEIIIIDEA